MADYKKLHEEWKEAKKTAKMFHEAVARMHLDVSQAHKDVKIGLGPFPKFDLDLGPSLDKIDKGKDLAKAKKQAEKALKQYQKDINSLIDAADRLPPVAEGERAKIQKGYLDHLPDFQAIRNKIEKAIDELEV